MQQRGSGISSVLAALAVLAIVYVIWKYATDKTTPSDVKSSPIRWMGYRFSMNGLQGPTPVTNPTSPTGEVSLVDTNGVTKEYDASGRPLTGDNGFRAKLRNSIAAKTERIRRRQELFGMNYNY